MDLALLFSLRLAALFHRCRSDIQLPRLEVRSSNSEFTLFIEPGWLERNPLTDTALSAEVEQWATLGFKLRVTHEMEGINPSDKATRSTTGA
jgi:exopolyphosphatase/guanosine-5'-triphosphate,3'-diphosphate pyrophosphatase